MSLTSRQLLGLEFENISLMEREFNEFLETMIKERLSSVLERGKSFAIQTAVEYFSEKFEERFFDSLLAFIQQYSLADAEILSPEKQGRLNTGFNLALFGAPGTGKTFAACDLIMGKSDEGIAPHGLPGRNRYCGGITPATFIRIGKAYEGRKFNFIVPEFNDWFKYRGMVEPLKLALERKKVSYETVREIIKPYKFDSFFSVNYNTRVEDQGYEIVRMDPNFSAIEDRMLCRLHKLTKEDFGMITSSMFKMFKGETDLREGAGQFRDNLTLIYAIETQCPLVKERFPYKPILAQKDNLSKLEKIIQIFLEFLPEGLITFSPRIVGRTIQLAGAMSLLEYFKQRTEEIEISDDALKWAVRFFCEEASARSKERVNADEIFEEIEQRFFMS